MIRSGFVSNSSSSSFILKAKDSSYIMKTPKEIVDNLDKYHRIIVVGRDMGDGDDIFELEPEIIETIKKYTQRFIDNAPIKFAVGDPEEYREETWEEMKNRPDDFYDHHHDEIVLKDYDSIDRELYNGFKYEFIKNYLLTNDEWEVIENYEFVDSEDVPERNMACYIFSNEYDLKELPTILRSNKRNIYLVENSFISKYNSFIPITYMKIDDKTEMDISKLRSDVRIFENFRWIDLSSTQEPVLFKFKLRGVYGIGNEVNDINLFYKKDWENEENNVEGEFYSEQQF